MPATAQMKWTWSVSRSRRLPAVGLPSLRPDREVVEFTERETELGVLRSWCTSADARAVQTIIGAFRSDRPKLLY
jgi:hypothetical protein